ncbi:MAG TPA: SoxR reducing system RseC family protein [Bacteroidales bacterium]|nr:SoxR reducing system RseC family protein [Bacteroidales bacterium]
MEKGKIISHEGVVVNAPGNGTAEVDIITGSACSGCHAKSACLPGNTEVKTITVKSDAPLKSGDRVTVTMEQSLGFRALMIGYIIPFIVLIAAFTVLTVAGAGELASALFSFASLAVYYIGVWIFREKIGEKFEFKIKS